MKYSFRLFRIWGIDVGIHYSWFFIFVLVSWSLAQGFFPQIYPGWSSSVYWIIAIAAALLLFMSVLLHELAHSLVARARGLAVSSITLFIFGGVSNLKEESQKPKVEFFMAIVGPLTSLALALIFWVLTGAIADQTSPMAAIFSYLALINLILAIFNLLPGFPLDGGRVLRSIIWAATGSLTKATNVAATIGQLFGWALIVFGVFQLLAGNFLGGLWIAFIGWFLSGAADASRKEVTLREYLGGVKVKDVMKPGTELVPPDISLQEVVWDIFQKTGGRAAPVCRNGSLEGIITITDIKAVPRDKWAQTKVSDVMKRDPLYKVSPDENLEVALRLIAQHDINQVLVKQQDNKCVGMLSRADIIRYIQFYQELQTKR